MRIFTTLSAIFTAIAGFIWLAYRWRHRIINTLLAISFLRKAAVTISMNVPAIREKILPALFGQRNK